MATNGRRRPARPRIEVVSARATDTEAAAITAALEQFLAETAPAPSGSATESPWLRAALEEGTGTGRQAWCGWGR
jgi:hypothetical protein